MPESRCEESREKRLLSVDRVLSLMEEGRRFHKAQEEEKKNVGKGR